MIEDLETQELEVNESSIATRLDLFISENFELSRSYIKELIELGNILINGKKVKASYKLKAGDSVTVSIPEPKELELEAEDIPLDIVHEDDDLIVVNKAINMITHPAPGVSTGTLVNALLYHFAGKLSGINGKLRPGIVHRLDKDTSGLIVVAKNDASHENLAKQIQDKTCKRVYQALVQGKIKIPEGQAQLEINKAIGRDAKQRKRMAVITDIRQKSRSALTMVKLKEHLRFKEQDYSFVECELKTGRTHQIRVHLSHIRHPILGDLTYGATDSKHIKIERPLLHAKKLAFKHPSSGEKMFFEIPLAADFERVLSVLRQT